MELETLENEIELILSKDKKTRGDDMYLYFVYICHHDASVLKTFVDSNYRLQKGISPFESVSRCRRKLQEKCPELRAPKEINEKRIERELDFRAYARGRKC